MWIPQTRGGRPNQHKWNHEAWMKKRCGHGGGCFIQITNPGNNLCLARVLVIAMVRIEKDEDLVLAAKWRTIQEQRPAHANGLQKQLAQRLMRQVGHQDHTGPCGEQEIRKLQATLEPEYQM